MSTRKAKETEPAPTRAKRAKRAQPTKRTTARNASTRRARAARAASPKPAEARARQAKTLSVVAPMYNEEANVDGFLDALLPALDALATAYEIVCVDDGSTDGTLAALVKRRERNPEIKVVSLSRNFGKDVALSAGLDHARGDVVIPMDSDLQDPPELIGPMLETWRDGYDVVYAARASRATDTVLKRTSADLFYRVFNRMVDTNIPHNAGDFRLLDRRVVDVLGALPERTRFMKGLMSWVGFRQTGLSYERPQRRAGESKWSWWGLWNFALDGITSFSTLPLRFWSYVGVTIAALSFLYAAFLMVRTLILGVDVPGYASLMVVVLFLGGLQMLTLGIIGEYLGRTFKEVKRRPLYIVRERLGIDG